MPDRDAATLAGAPCWIELFTTDPGASRTFYGELFGWSSEDAGPDYGGYINFLKDGLPVAGCMQHDGSTGTPNVWSVYLASDDAEATVAAAVIHGGQVYVPAMDVMELGRMALVADAGQAAVGIWQAGLHKGFAVRNRPGTPGWFELHTRDYDASVRFYRDVFGWDTHVAGDQPDFRYTTLGAGVDGLAGIMDASTFVPDGAPAHWAVYFQVEDADATLAKAVALGGSITMPAEDTPFGRLAQATDPAGAMFKLVAN